MERGGWKGRVGEGWKGEGGGEGGVGRVEGWKGEGGVGREGGGTVFAVHFCVYPA